MKIIEGAERRGPNELRVVYDVAEGNNDEGEEIDGAIHIYARIFTNGDVEVANRSLRMHLKEHMVWERNTIWKDMIGMEPESQAVTFRPSSEMKRELSILAAHVPGVGCARNGLLMYHLGSAAERHSI
ncbi:hypothetical protein EDD21DRAFT_433508 [Dissophora ornata]|nr:low-affinity phosphate transporter [Dissophora ornata]KAI8599277.1 hypothetical protein EDD21DRAFT_433508 [Dissophora ornata]